MVKKTLLSMAIAAAVVSLAGCNVSTTDKYDNKISNAGVEYAQKSSVYPIFAPEAGKVPLAIDLLFADAQTTDGTLSTNDTAPPVTTAMNSLDGFSVSAPIVIEFSQKLDQGTVVAGETVHLIKLNNLNGEALVVDEGNPFATEQVLADDYEARAILLDDGDTPAIQIALKTPLDPMAKYLVVLTDGIKGANGDSISQPATYSHAAGDDKLMSDLLIPVRPLVKGWQEMAQGYLSLVLKSPAKSVFSYTFTTGGTTSGLKMAAAPEMYVRTLANKPDTAEKLFMAAQAGGYLANLGLTAPPTPEQQAAAESYAKTQWMTSVVTPVITANSDLAFADPVAPEDEELTKLRANPAYQTAIKGAANNSQVIGGITAQLKTPKAQKYTAIPGVALTPAQALAGTPLAADSITKYVQGSLELPSGLSKPTMTNSDALASGDAELMAGAVKLSMASDKPWSADPTLNPPKDNKKFNPATGKLVDAFEDTEKKIPNGMTNVTYRYPLVNLNNLEHAPVLVTLPGDYTPAGGNNCTGLAATTGLPVIVFLHGITSDRTSSIAVGATAASKGCFATVALDLPLHGVAPLSSDRDGKSAVNTAMVFNVEQNPTSAPYAAAAQALAEADRPHERHFNIASASNARVDMVFGADVQTSLGKSGDQFINLANMTRLRDNLRQAVVDNMHLLASLENIATAHGTQFDMSKVYVAGHSLGAILATTLTTVVNDPAVQTLNGLDNGKNLPKIQAAVLANPGASLPKMLENSPGFAPTILGGLGLAQDSSDLQKYEAVLQAALDSVDPIGFAEELAAQDTPVLLYNAVGGGDCTDYGSGKTSCDRLPTGIAAAFQGKYPADHVVPNFDYFADAGINPFARIMPGLDYKLDGVQTQVKEVSSAYAPLAGTNPLSKLAGLTPWNGVNATEVSKTEIQFDKATHSTFAAADDAATFETMMTQMITFFTTNGANLNPAKVAGVKKAE